MKLQIEQLDVDMMRNHGKLTVHLSAYWKKEDGSLFALASGDVELQPVEGMVEELFRRL